MENRKVISFRCNRHILRARGMPSLAESASTPDSPPVKAPAALGHKIWAHSRSLSISQGSLHSNIFYLNLDGCVAVVMVERWLTGDVEFHAHPQCLGHVAKAKSDAFEGGVALADA